MIIPIKRFPGQAGELCHAELVSASYVKPLAAVIYISR